MWVRDWESVFLYVSLSQTYLINRVGSRNICPPEPEAERDGTRTTVPSAAPKSTEDLSPYSSVTSAYSSKQEREGRPTWGENRHYQRWNAVNSTRYWPPRCESRTGSQGPRHPRITRRPAEPPFDKEEVQATWIHWEKGPTTTRQHPTSTSNPHPWEGQKHPASISRPEPAANRDDAKAHDKLSADPRPRQGMRNSGAGRCPPLPP